MMSRRAYRQLTMGSALLLSLCVHGWVLLQPMPPQPVAAAPAAPGIAVQVLHPASPARVASTTGSPVADHPPASPARTGSLPATPRAHRLPVQAPAAPPPTPVADVRSRTPEHHAEPAAANPDKLLLLARIKTDLARHFHYPRIARQRGWEGEVILGFILNADGRITTIRILKSSGFLLLDQAARQSLARVEPLQLASLHITGNSEMELPVLYRLTGS